MATAETLKGNIGNWLEAVGKIDPALADESVWLDEQYIAEVVFKKKAVRECVKSMLLTVLDSGASVEAMSGGLHTAVLLGYLMGSRAKNEAIN